MQLEINEARIERDFFGDIALPDCPPVIRSVAERILVLLVDLRLSPPSLNGMARLDQFLILNYWKLHDGMNQSDFEAWFMSKATYPERIRRARQWLVEQRILILPDDILKRAQREEARWRNEIR